MKHFFSLALSAGVMLLIVASAAGQSSYPVPPNTRITYIDELNNEEQVFICPTDSNIIIANWRDFRLGYRQIGIGRSVNGGVTWVDSLISEDMQYFGDQARQSDPTMTVDRFGNFYMSVLDYDGLGPTDGSVISFYKSTDKGISWTGPVINVAEIVDPDIFEDKQFFTCDRTGGPYDGNIYCSWTRFPNPDRIMLVRSTDGCQSFEDTVLVGPIQTSTGCGTSEIDAGQFSIPIVTANGDVHVFWQGYVLDSGLECTGYTAIKHSVSSDGALTFSTEDAVLGVSGYTYANGSINTYSMPVGDADITDGPFDGNLYLAFTNQGAEDAYHTDVDFIRSTDNGVTWSERYQINDAPDAASMDAFHPWLIVNEEGILIVVFYDQRFDPYDYLLFDLIAAYSFDGGETFTTNHRISSASSSPYNLASALETSAPFVQSSDDLLAPLMMAPMAGLIGEYIGVTAFHDKIQAIWTDSRDGNSEVYGAGWYMPLLEPRLAAPSNFAEVTAPITLRWSTTWKNNEDQYRVEWSDTEDFSGTVTSAVVDTNFYVLDAAPFEGATYWRVKAFDITTSDSSEYSDTWTFSVTGGLICGDLDGSGEVDPMDLIYFVDWIWNAGPDPVSIEVADVNNDDQVDGMDVVHFVDWLWNEGADLICW